MDEKDFADRLKNTGRNDECPCGSGKKYKKCHLAKDEMSWQKEVQTQQEAAGKEGKAEGDADRKTGKPPRADTDERPRFKSSANVARHNAPRRQAGI